MLSSALGEREEKTYMCDTKNKDDADSKRWFSPLIHIHAAKEVICHLFSSHFLCKAVLFRGLGVARQVNVLCKDLDLRLNRLRKQTCQSMQMYNVFIDHQYQEIYINP